MPNLVTKRSVEASPSHRMRTFYPTAILFTTRYYAECGIARISRPSVRPSVRPIR